MKVYVNNQYNKLIKIYHSLLTKNHLKNNIKFRNEFKKRSIEFLKTQNFDSKQQIVFNRDLWGIFMNTFFPKVDIKNFKQNFSNISSKVFVKLMFEKFTKSYSNLFKQNNTYPNDKIKQKLIIYLKQVNYNFKNDYCINELQKIESEMEKIFYSYHFDLKLTDVLETKPKLELHKKETKTTNFVNNRTNIKDQMILKFLEFFKQKKQPIVVLSTAMLIVLVKNTI